MPLGNTAPEADRTWKVYLTMNLPSDRRDPLFRRCHRIGGSLGLVRPCGTEAGSHGEDRVAASLGPR